MSKSYADLTCNNKYFKFNLVSICLANMRMNKEYFNKTSCNMCFTRANARIDIITTAMLKLLRVMGLSFNKLYNYFDSTDISHILDKRIPHNVFTIGRRSSWHIKFYIEIYDDIKFPDNYSNLDTEHKYLNMILMGVKIAARDVSKMVFKLYELKVSYKLDSIYETKALLDFLFVKQRSTLGILLSGTRSTLSPIYHISRMNHFDPNIFRKIISLSK